MDRQTVLQRLFSLRDEKYADFQKKLLPTVPPDRIIGVRTPALRALAKEMVKSGEGEAFVGALPHGYFDENQLHAFIISETRVFAACAGQVQAFLPYVDNWATCDQLSPKVFKKHRQDLLPLVEEWLRSQQTYTLRFAIGMLMEHFLDGNFDERYLEMVARVRSGEYYVRMMAAWYFATALAKQYDAALPYISQHRLDDWTHGKAIQKAVESDRIPPERKEQLKAFRNGK